MPDLKFQNKIIHFNEAGSGVPVVLCHAASPAAGSIWDKASAKIADHYRSIIPDLWAFGKSSAWEEEGPLTHAAQADLLLALIGAETSEPVHLVGHSYGGASAVAAALREPEAIRSLILIEPLLMPLLQDARHPEMFAGYRKMAETFMTFAQAGNETKAWQCFIDYWTGEGSWDRMPEKAQQCMLSQTKMALSGFPGNLSDPTTVAHVRRLSVPTLVVCGEATAPQYRTICTILSENLPNCSSIEIPEAGHLSVMSHPTEISDAILSYLAQSH